MCTLTVWVTLWLAASACGAEQPGQWLVGQGDRIDQFLVQADHRVGNKYRTQSADPVHLFVSEPVSVLSSSRLQRAEEGDNSPFLIDFRRKPITDLKTSILPRSSYVPDSVAQARLDELGAVSYESVLMRRWMGLRYCWDAPSLYHQPLYFEEVNLERHGYGPRGLRAVQPVISGAHFFATVPTLPYQMATNPPRQPVYALGHYRPGSPAPYRVQYPPLSIPGSLAEAAVIVGLIALIP